MIPVLPPLDYVEAAGRMFRRFWESLDGPNWMRAQRLSIIGLVIAFLVGAVVFVFACWYFKTALDEIKASILTISAGEIPELKSRRDIQVKAIEDNAQALKDNLKHLTDVVDESARNINRQIIVSDGLASAINKLADRTSRTEGQFDVLRGQVYGLAGEATRFRGPDSEQSRHNQAPPSAPVTPPHR